MAVVITIPGTIILRKDKIEYLISLKAKAYVVMSRMSTWYRNGATLTQYNNLLPNKLKVRYPYVSKLSKTSWIDFIRLFMDVILEIELQLNQLTNNAASDATITADFNNDITF